MALQKLPDSIQNYIQYIIQSDCADKIVLFGSRARGDQRENSDFDIAVQWKNPSSQAVFQLKSDLAEQPLTLYQVDLLDLNSASPIYMEKINREGQVLWLKKG